VDAREIVGPDLSAFEDAEGAPEEAADPVWSPLDADGAGAGAVPYDPPELPAEEWAPEEINASMGEWHPSLVESDSDDHAALPPPAGSDALSLEGGSARRRFSLRARSVNPRLLVLLGVVAVAGGAFAVMHRGSGDSASAPVAAATQPAPAAKTTARTQAAHRAAAPAAGWTRIAVPAGRFTVDMPAGFHQAVDGSLVTFTAPAGTRAYAVNGSATGGGAPGDAVRRLVQSYRHDYRLLELSTRTTGAGAVEIAARGVRRSSGVRERILAAAFRAPRSAHGLLVVQSFSNDAAARQDRAGRAEFERVRRTVRLAG
jgi:hypothetical protein